MERFELHSIIFDQVPSRIGKNSSENLQNIIRSTAIERLFWKTFMGQVLVSTSFLWDLFSFMHEHWETSRCIVLDLDASHYKLCYKSNVLTGRSFDANYTIITLRPPNVVLQFHLQLMVCMLSDSTKKIISMAGQFG